MTSVTIQLQIIGPCLVFMHKRCTNGNVVCRTLLDKTCHRTFADDRSRPWFVVVGSKCVCFQVDLMQMLYLASSDCNYVQLCYTGYVNDYKHTSILCPVCYMRSPGVLEYTESITGQMA